MAKRNFLRRLSRALALPADAAMPVPRLEITGQGDLLVTGGAELLEYSPELIRLSRDGCEVSIHGTELLIAAMDQMGIQIYGSLTSVTFAEEGGRDAEAFS